VEAFLILEHELAEVSASPGRQNGGARARGRNA